MKTHFYVNCSTDQLMRSARDENYFRSRMRKREPGRFAARSPSEVILRLSPENGALPHPLLLTLNLEGQVVKRASVEIGWQHQGLEKNLEDLTWLQAEHYMARMSRNKFSSLSMAYRLAIEILFGIDEQILSCERYLRIARLETERVLQHLMIVDRLARLFPRSPKSNRATEMALHRVKEICGRLCANADLVELEAILEPLNLMTSATEIALNMLRDDQNIRGRLRGLSHYELAHGLSEGLTGIYIRAAGVYDDLRSDHPHLPYTRLGFQPQSAKGSDAYARFELRLLEIAHSLTLIDQALKNCMEEGPLPAESARQSPFADPEACPAPHQVATGYVESPEGEVAVTVCSSGESSPYRVRIKSPSFALTSAISLFLTGCDIDDVVTILNTLGINTLETDR